MDIKFDDLVNRLQDNNVYMLIGNGRGNQYRHPDVLCHVLAVELENVPKNSAFLYFGDRPNPTKPDIGVLFEFMHRARPDIDIHLIQISPEGRSRPPGFVTTVYSHEDYNEDFKYGGLDWNDEPQSNTKKWVEIHRALQEHEHRGIRRVIVFGGESIELDAIRMAKLLRIPLKYHPSERLFRGDGKTLIPEDARRSELVGCTLIAESATFGVDGED